MKIASVGIAVAALLLASCSGEGTSADGAGTDASSEAATGEVAAETTEQAITGLFASSDLNQSGFLTREEAVAFMELSLISQDTDEDGRLSLDEFQTWDAGFLAIATAKGAADGYQAAKADLFKAWDSDGDGYLVPDEYDAGIKGDFAAAPKQETGRMTQAEFAEVRFVKALADAAE